MSTYQQWKPGGGRQQQMVEDVACMTLPRLRSSARSNAETPVFDEEVYARNEGAAHAAITSLHQTMMENLDQNFIFQVRRTSTSEEDNLEDF